MPGKVNPVVPEAGTMVAAQVMGSDATIGIAGQSGTIAKTLIEGAEAPDPTMSFMVASSLAFAGVLALPSAWYARKRITNPEFEPAPRQEPRNFALILTVLTVVLVAGAGARPSR